MGRALAAALLLCGLLVALAPARSEPRPERTFRECAECPQMVGIPAGSFLMGSPPTEQGRFDTEGPQHMVSIRAFALSEREVTAEQFLAFLRESGYQPAPCNSVLELGWQSPGRGKAYPPGETPPRWPATCLSWDDAEAYIAWLNGKVAQPGAAARAPSGPYRLPTEAEWEYAARAGTTTARWWGDAVGTGQANCNGCGSAWDNRLIAPVGSFAPNAFGLYDMLGNVWQFTSDCWHESYAGAPADGSAWIEADCPRRVLRGGSWSNVPVFVRSAARIGALSDGTDSDNSNYAGIRVARTLP